MENLINKIVTNPQLHCSWLNTLSMMENVGARKIKNCEDPVFVSEMILKHAAEEARHAYFLKKQISKIINNACHSYEKKYLIAPDSSFYYLNHLDIMICKYLKSTFGFSGQKLKYAAYLLVTYAIEVRADWLYPVYQKVLDYNKSKVNVKSIIAEEKNHLEEMTSMLKEFSGHWQEMTINATKLEATLFDNWILELEKCV
jgi:hypothetical protein